VGEVTPAGKDRRRRALPEGYSRRTFPGSADRWLLWQDDTSGRGGPLLLCLHGRGEGAIAFARTTNMGPAATSAGFRVAIPQGQGMVADWDDDERDLEPISGLVDDLAAPDAACVVVGMSRGAGLAAALLHARPDQYSGLVAVAGTPGPLPTPGLGHPRLYVHGDLDRAVPVREVVDHVAAVAAATGCGPGESGGPVEGVDAVYDRSNAATTVFPHPHGSDVTLVRLPGGGHVWPGAAEPHPRRLGTVVSWPATAAVLAFARRCVAGTSG